MTSSAHEEAKRITHYMLGLERGTAPGTHAALDNAWNSAWYATRLNGRDHAKTADRIDERQRLQRDRGYATLCAESLACIDRYTAGRRIVDIGAGAGHLARVLRANARDVAALDLGPEGGYIETAASDVTNAEALQWLDAELGPDDAVLLCWPPGAYSVHNYLGHDTLARLGPHNQVIYIGEDDDGCTATPGFHTLWRQQWHTVGHAPVAPMIGRETHDSLWIGTRHRPPS